MSVPPPATGAGAATGMSASTGTVTFTSTPSSSTFTFMTAGFLFVAEASTVRVPGSTGTPVQSGSPFGSPSTFTTSPGTRASLRHDYFQSRQARLQLLGMLVRELHARLVRRRDRAFLLLDRAELTPCRRRLADVLVAQREVQQRAVPRSSR